GVLADLLAVDEGAGAAAVVQDSPAGVALDLEVDARHGGVGHAGRRGLAAAHLQGLAGVEREGPALVGAGDDDQLCAHGTAGTNGPPAVCPVCGAAVGSETETVPPRPVLGAACDAKTIQPRRPAEAAPTLADHAPDRVSVPGYAILGELGRGGMGVVYKARQV